MAEVKIGFATFNPSQGNGNESVTVTSENNTGRNSRETKAKLAADAGGLEKIIIVSQQGASENVTLNTERASVEKTGGILILAGKSNSSKLTFTYQHNSENGLIITAPNTFTANGEQATSGTEIAGDPGATKEYDFNIQLTIPKNTDDVDLTGTLTVTANNNNSATCTITQLAGDKTLSVNSENVSLTAEGTETTLQVTSNTNWTISAYNAPQEGEDEAEEETVEGQS